MHDGPGQISAHPDGSVTPIRLTGEVDAALRDQASRAMADALTGGRPVELDLGGVDFIDSSGLAFLLQCHRACLQVGLGCAVTHVPDTTMELIRLTGLDEVLAIRA
ncbi:STAS domain-containing protein [Cellulomonas sp. Marseille-Q8402]